MAFSHYPSFNAITKKIMFLPKPSPVKFDREASIE